MPELPRDFDERQLGALRALLVLAKGHFRTTEALATDSIDARELNRVIGEQGRLDLQSEAGRRKVQAIYDVVHRVLREDKYGLRAAIQPLYRQVYGGEHAKGWELAEVEARSGSLLSISALARRLEGVYLSYRRGTAQGEHGEIIISPLRIYQFSEGAAVQIYFEFGYPLRSAAGQGFIRGKVIPLLHHLYFMGYDEGSSSPYLLCAFRAPGDSRIEEISGVALRTTTESVAFAARIYARRHDEKWEEAIDQAGMEREEDFKLMQSDIYSSIMEYIDNEINNITNFVLRQYAKKARSRR